LDEIEKAHSDVFNVLLQLLDEGRLTDSRGRNVDFKNTIVIMTSNIGSQYLLEGIDNGEITEEARNNVTAALHKYFKPEILNRMDDIIMFKPLSRNDMTFIVDKIVNQLNVRLIGNGVRVHLTDTVKTWIADTAYEPQFGARPLKRFVQKEIETPLAKLLIKEDYAEGTEITIDRVDDEVVFKAG
ncbi:MAG: AAA family ATPase, partial [Macrococcus canis]|uniref:AAA family ATPase n=1 Tax=Macrococcoides canis TaxID=1855823 RepID=UPI002E7A6933